MVPAIILAHLWAVAQLTTLGSLTRTVSVRTLLLAMATGFYLCGPLALLLQYPLAHLYGMAGGVSAYEAAKVTGYTIDPWIEEIVKVLPIIAVLRFASLRRQWSLTDCTLVGAATGAGFGLAEDLFRYGAAAAQANPSPTGWTLATNISLPLVAGYKAILTAWLPMPVSTIEIFLRAEHGMPWINIHLAYSATVGFAAGLMFLDRRRLAVLVGIALLALTSLDHGAVNAASEYGSWYRNVLVPPFNTLRETLGWRPLIVLIIAWWIDRRRQRAMDGPVIALDTLRAAVSHLPGSLFAVWRFVRLRRAYYAARQVDTTGPPDLRAEVEAARMATADDRLRSTTGKWAATLRTPSAIATTIVAIPGLIFFLIGGWPQTAWLQASLLTGAGWGVTRVVSIVALGLMIWRARRLSSLWSLGVRQPAADDIATFAYGMGVTAGGCLLLGGAVSKILLGGSGTLPMFRLHMLDAAGSSSTGSTALLGTAPHAMHYPPGIGPVSSEGSQAVPPSRAPQPIQVPKPAPNADDADDPEMSLDDMAKWAAEADAREAAEAAQAALARAAEADAKVAAIDADIDAAFKVGEPAQQEFNAAKKAADELDPTGYLTDNAKRAFDGLPPWPRDQPWTDEQHEAQARLERAWRDMRSHPIPVAGDNIYAALAAAKAEADARAAEANAAVAEAQRKALEAAQATAPNRKPDA
jgi:RsiW-degrading membrane proteinase PrsW (M82 family)